MSYFCPPLTQIGMCLISNVLQIASTFHENPSGGRYFVPWRWTDRQRDMTNQRVVLRNCAATVPKLRYHKINFLPDSCWLTKSRGLLNPVLWECTLTTSEKQVCT